MDFSGIVSKFLLFTVTDIMQFLQHVPVHGWKNADISRLLQHGKHGNWRTFTFKRIIC